MKNKKTDFIVKSAVIAAFYAVLTLVLGPLAFSPLGIGIELRLSEALTILPVFTFSAVPGLTIGCIIANFIGISMGNVLGVVDIVVGSSATLIAAILSYLLRNVKLKGYPFFSFLPPIICNALIVGLELTLMMPKEFSFIYAFISVGLGELIVVFVAGTPLYYLIKKFNFFGDNVNLNK